MNKGFLFVFITISFVLGIHSSIVKGQTYCNPLNLNYIFSHDQSSKHDLADPTIVLYKDNYYLFASNAGGYWYSSDLLSWKLISDTNLPLENLTPTAVVIGDWIYFFSSLSDKIYRSNNPASGKWEVYCNSILLSMISDFSIFADTDGRVYCYYGCSNNDGVMSRELDAKNLFNPIGVPVVCQKTNPLKSGWYKRKDNSAKTGSFNVKGSWMNKFNGKYYYQCAEINSILNNYSDAVYVSDAPMGPFTFAANNPFSYRPDGFVCGAGNGSTFADKYGNWWHIASLTAPNGHESHYGVGLFPAGFDKEGDLFTRTDFGDYPMMLPNNKITNISKLDPEWSLLTDHLTAQASTSMASSPVTNAFDENIETYWSAQTGDTGEWLCVDLGSEFTINAYQLNFAVNKTKINGAEGIPAYQYLVEYSMDKKNWKTLSDKTANTEYRTNPYEALRTPIQAQYIKITNYHVPEGSFAISGFRIFGSGSNRRPKKVNSFRAVRDYRNPQIIKMSWEKQANTTGYNIRYGTDKDKLYHSYQVYKKPRLTIHCPDKNKTYWFEVDAYNENGVTLGKPILAH